MRNRLVPVAAVLAVAVLVFVFGLALGATGVIGMHPSVLTADGGYVGQETATLTVGDTSYGFHASVPWRDSSGAQIDRGWPACLTPFSSPAGVRFAGAVVWSGSVGQAEVLWVDCSGGGPP